ncbi:unnamed protein product, partial [Brassica rapa subsp. narinosa]
MSERDLSNARPLLYSNMEQDHTSLHREGEKQGTTTRETRSPRPFKDRVDRHGNSFGTRVATKQTRVPPPTKNMMSKSDIAETWRKDSNLKEPEPVIYSSPSYTTRREPAAIREHYKRAPFPQRELKEWRVKPTTVTVPEAQKDSSNHLERRDSRTEPLQLHYHQSSEGQQTEEEIQKDLHEATMLYLSCSDPTEAAARRQRVKFGDDRGQVEETTAALLKAQGRRENYLAPEETRHNHVTIRSKEQVLEDLNAVTLQYLSCSDPTEAAARRQRVLNSEASGLVEKTAASILASETTPRRPLSPWEQGIKSISPPGEGSLMGLRQDQIFTPIPREEEDLGFDPPYSVEPAQINTLRVQEVREHPARIRSIIVSPPETTETSPLQQQLIPELQEEETLNDFQNKVRERTVRHHKARSPRSGTNVLRGASTKKRRLSQILHSPGANKKQKNDVPNK